MASLQRHRAGTEDLSPDHVQQRYLAWKVEMDRPGEVATSTPQITATPIKLTSERDRGTDTEQFEQKHRSWREECRKWDEKRIQKSTTHTSDTDV